MFGDLFSLHFFPLLDAVGILFGKISFPVYLWPVQSQDILLTPG